MVAKVTISGHPGSGTSTLVEGVCKTLSWSKLNGGQVFREMAEERGVSLEEFGQQCMEDASVDQALDKLLVETMLASDSPEIVESRLAGWWAYKKELHCPRVWIDVSERVRAERVVNREGGSLEDQIKLIRERMESDGSRYSEYYDIDIDSHDPYTCVIESDDMSIEDVLAHVLHHLEEFY